MHFSKRKNFTHLSRYLVSISTRLTKGLYTQAPPPVLFSMSPQFGFYILNPINKSKHSFERIEALLHLPSHPPTSNNTACLFQTSVGLMKWGACTSNHQFTINTQRHTWWFMQRLLDFWLNSHTSRSPKSSPWSRKVKIYSETREKHWVQRRSNPFLILEEYLLGKGKQQKNEAEEAHNERAQKNCGASSMLSAAGPSSSSSWHLLSYDSHQDTQLPPRRTISSTATLSLGHVLLPSIKNLGATHSCNSSIGEEQPVTELQQRHKRWNATVNTYFPCPTDTITTFSRKEDFSKWNSTSGGPLMPWSLQYIL